MDYRPAYMRIVEDIQEDIEKGVYRPGDLIPTQMQIARKYQVSRITVRDAVNELIHRGLLYTRQGKGTFVVERSDNPYPAVRTGSFSEKSKGSGGRILTTVTGIERIEADSQQAKALSVKEGDPLIRLSRIRSIDGIKMIYSRAHLSVARFKDIDFFQIDFSRQSLYGTLSEKTGLSISGAEEEFRAILCPPEVAGLLEYGTGEAVLHVIRRTFDDRGTCFEWCEQFERTDRFPVRIKSGD